MLTHQSQQSEIVLQQCIFPVLPSHLVAMISSIPTTALADVTEIRLRVNKPLLLVVGKEEMLVSPLGRTVVDPQFAYLCSRDDIQRILQLISKNSMYAFEQELKMGFLTIQGGHRIGLAGQAIMDGGEIKSLKHISSLNIRMAREVKGCADVVMPYLFAGEQRLLSTLVISPPRCGKTTLLRDLIRQLSTGTKACRGLQVGVVDERSEIAACNNGVPTVDLGPRTDVLDGCPKASGMLMLIRSMSPAVVATDELGRAEDVYAIREALNAGVNVLATVHGRNISEVLQRPYVGELIQKQYFERYVELSDNPRVGTVVRVMDGQQNQVSCRHRANS